MINESGGVYIYKLLELRSVMTWLARAADEYPGVARRTASWSEPPMHACLRCLATILWIESSSKARKLALSSSIHLSCRYWLFPQAPDGPPERRPGWPCRIRMSKVCTSASSSFVNLTAQAHVPHLVLFILSSIKFACMLTGLTAAGIAFHVHLLLQRGVGGWTPTLI